MQQPAFLKALDRALGRDLARRLEDLPALAPAARGGRRRSRRRSSQENFAFYEKYLGGAAEMKPRWKRCAESTDELLGEALGQKYVEKYFPPEAKARMQELVKNLLLAMGDTIRGLDWMSPPTKAKALEKLATFNPKIGYPDKWKDYSQVPVARGAYWQDVVAGRRFNVADDRAQIGKPVDRGRWGMTPPTSNAYYNPLLNEIVFPAGILQPPAFDVNAADAVNYGAIGVVIGHEISHGFDDQGAQYDAQGRLANWWTARGPEEVPARAGSAWSTQFEGYFVEPGIHHNGKLVLGESIGDLAGAKIAYRAFQIAQKTRPGADARRLHARPAVLHRLGPVPRRRDPAGDAAAHGAGRPAPDRQVPRDRPAVEPARVPEGLRLRRGHADGAAGRASAARSGSGSRADASGGGDESDRLFALQRANVPSRGPPTAGVAVACGSRRSLVGGKVVRQLWTE